jgi:hypothetical protein
MKKFLLLLSVVALSFTGCYEEDWGPDQPNVNDIVLSQTEGAVSAPGGSFQLQVTSDYSWTASSDVSWLTVNTKSGNPGTSYLYFTVAQNTTQSQRVGYITVLSDDYNLSAQFMLTQAAGSSQSEATFSFEFKNVTSNSVDVYVTPSDDSASYWYDIYPLAEFNELGTAAEFMQAYYMYIKATIESMGYPFSSALDQGASNFTYTELDANTAYVAFAFQVDPDSGELVSTELSHDVFTTASNQNSPLSAWLGTWEVTSPKTYVQQNNSSTGKYEEGIINQSLTRQITIDTLDEAQGTVVVYGWDGYFLNDAPAVGIVVDNTLELVNNIVVHEDTSNGAVYQWMAQSELPTYDPSSLYMVGGDYPPYKFVMNSEGKATINPYKGQITSGDEFTVVSFTIWPVIGEQIYVWNYAEPALTFSGDTMSAVKVSNATRAVKSVKLDAPKKHVAAEKKVAKSASAQKQLKSYKFAK